MQGWAKISVAIVGVAILAASGYFALLPDLARGKSPVTPIQTPSGEGKMGGQTTVGVSSLVQFSALPPPPELKIQTSGGIRFIVSPDKILSGGPPKDGIPSIDRPKFITAKEATFLSDNDWVLGIELDEVIRAYPLQILVWHEIVNDEINGKPVLITYCPLCFSSIAFYGVINGEPVQFGTSGKLYNSDLVMYDRKTDSYWSQILGQGIVGELTGYSLKRIPIDLVRWSDWKALHPETHVLSRDTGFARAYGIDPYGNYYFTPGIFFPIERTDTRLPVKELVFGISINGENKAYVQKLLTNVGLLNDVVGGQEVVLMSPAKDMVRAFSRNVDGQVLTFEFRDGKFFDKETGTEWNYSGVAIVGELKGKVLERIPGMPGFWFAWAVFYSNTLLHN